MTEEEKKLQPETVTDGAEQSAAKLPAAQKTPAPTYANSFGGALQKQYEAIVNRQPFSYNAAEDPLYQQYVDKYVQGGRLAMRDTMGQAAALTGGYGSSYGQAVGQQQYNEYMRGLNDVLPELYGQAYGRWQDEGDQLQTEYGMLQDLEADEYAKYRDAYADWLYDEEVQYDRQRDAYDNLQNLIAATGMEPTEEQLAASGMSAEEARALRLAWARSDPNMALRGGYISDEDYQMLTGIDPNATGGGGGGGYYESSDPWTRKLQQKLMEEGYQLNYGADGIYGNETQSMAEAWAAANPSAFDEWLKNNPN